MSCLIKSINYCPVKSVSFQSIEKSNIKKNLGMTNDRIFAFSRGIDSNKSKLLEKDPNQRKLNNFLTLKNSPALNKYNFFYKNEKLTLTYQEKELVTITLNTAAKFIRSQLRATPQNLQAKQWIANELQAKKRI